jgi:hypothetical protein
MLLIEQTNLSPSTHTSTLYLDQTNDIILLSPDSPTFRVMDDDDKLFDEKNRFSDIDISTPYLAVNLIIDSNPPLPNKVESSKDDESIKELSTGEDDDPSLVLARNNLSQSFSKWEFDPEDGAFHNSNQRMLLIDDFDNQYDRTYIPLKKRVRFMADPEDSKMIYCRFYTDPNVLTHQEVLKGWYHSSEIKKFRHQNHKEAFLARKLTSSLYNENMLELYNQCTKSISLLSGPHNKLATIVASSIHRGHEALIFFELFRKDRKRMVKDLLKAQDEFRSTSDGNHYTVDQLSTMLGSKSRILSRKSRRFAYVIGLGDAEVAKKLISSKELQCIMTSTRKCHTQLYNCDSDECTASISNSSDQDEAEHNPSAYHLEI